MTDGNKKSEKRRRGRGIQRSGAIRSLSFFFLCFFCFPCRILDMSYCHERIRGKLVTDRDSRTEVNRYNSDFLLIFGEGMREKRNNVKNADLSHEDNNRKTVKRERKGREGRMGRRTGAGLFCSGVSFAIT